jgi:hypothetical protein
MRRGAAVLFLALGFALAASPALAQSAPRIRATLISFQGNLLTVETNDHEQQVIELSPTALIVQQQKRTLADIKAGDYVGATFLAARDGSRRAQEVHIFPDVLRGSGEGLFGVDGGRFMIDGTVKAAGPALLTIAYRGAGGGDGANCTGRAPRAGGCQGEADIAVAPGVPVRALVPGDKNLLVPGAVLAISLVAGNGGHPMSPGLTVEGMAVDGPAPPPAGRTAPPPVARPPGRPG